MKVLSAEASAIATGRVAGCRQFPCALAVHWARVAVGAVDGALRAICGFAGSPIVLSLDSNAEAFSTCSCSTPARGIAGDCGLPGTLAVDWAGNGACAAGVA